ncbi:MAG: response regulator [Nitrospiria bacterium]
MKKTTLLIVDDHPIYREGVTAIISKQPDYKKVGEAEDGKEALEKVLRIKPDIVIMDVVMPRIDGLLATEMIKKSAPKTKILILSMYQQKEYIFRAFRSGADGYISKSNRFDELLFALKQVRTGRRYASPLIADFLLEEYCQAKKSFHYNLIDSLSLREKEILRFIVEGESSREISELLCLSLATIKTHRNTIMKKLDVHNLASLTRYCLEKGVVCSSEFNTKTNRQLNLPNKTI